MYLDSDQENGTVSHLGIADASKYLTVREAARELGIRDTSLRRREDSDRKFLGRTLVAARDVASWRARKRGESS